MRIIKAWQKDASGVIDGIINRHERIPAGVEESVREILNDVKNRGDAALIAYTEKFDNVSLKPLEMKVKKKEIRDAYKKVSKKFIDAIELSAQRIGKFHEKQRQRSWMYSEDGALLGQLVTPLHRIGIYVPGGKAAYPSSVIMNTIPAKMAGVKEVVMCSPSRGKIVNPEVLVAADISGVDEIYRIGGAQAIGAMAYGTETIKKVDKIVGPGNIYISIAKKIVFGDVDIDMIAGPSEILIIADKTAEPSFVAADMLSQAEHDEMASAILITNSEELATNVDIEIKRQLRGLNRKKIAEKSLENSGWIILTKSLTDAVDLANDIAPEHLELSVEEPFELLAIIRNAGAIFLGNYTPEALGDYSAGPNHVLPTGGTAKFFSPLNVDDFTKRSSILYFSKDGMRKLANAVVTIADSEGLQGHREAVKVRMRK